jgi:hypothetical protein
VEELDRTLWRTGFWNILQACDKTIYVIMILIMVMEECNTFFWDVRCNTLTSHPSDSSLVTILGYTPQLIQRYNAIYKTELFRRTPSISLVHRVSRVHTHTYTHTYKAINSVPLCLFVSPLVIHRPCRELFMKYQACVAHKKSNVKHSIYCQHDHMLLLW